MKIETQTFQLTPSAYVSVIMGRWLVRNLWLFALLLSAVIAGVIAVGVVFVYIGLMLLFLIFPTVLMITYFNYALKPGMRDVVSPCKVSISEDVLSIVSTPTEELQHGFEDKHISLEKISDLKFSGKKLVVVVGRHIDDVIVIPESAFGEDRDSLHRFTDVIYRSIQRNSLTLRS